MLKSLFLTLFLITASSVAQAGNNRPDFQVNFKATTIQGTTCEAPCVVHLDATATTVEGMEDEYSELNFEWTCSNGFFANPGIISTCVFNEPGVSQIALTVTDRATGYRQIRGTRIVVAPASSVRTVILQRGNTYPSLSLASGGGIVKAVGQGPAPIVNSGVAARDGWTIDGIDIRGGVSIAPEVSNFTLINSSATSVATATGGGTKHNKNIALVNNTITSRPVGTLVFLRVEDSIVYNNILDNQGSGEFNLRTVHFPRSVIALNTMRRPGNLGVRNNLQIRAWASSFVPRTPTEYVVVYGNSFSDSTGNWIVRTCASNLCGTESTSPPLRYVLFEENKFIGSMLQGLNIQGSNFTIRNNDFTEWTGRYIAQSVPAVGSSGFGRHKVYDNNMGGRPVACNGGGFIQCE